MIRLHSLTISRFRGIREGGVRGLTDVNLLIGRNNSGKTTIVEALMRLLMGNRPAAPDLLGRPVDQLWGQVRQDGGQYTPEFWYRHDQTQPIVLDAKLGDTKNQTQDKDLTLSLRVKANQGNPQVEPSETAVEGGLTKAQVMSFLNGINLFRPLDGVNPNIEGRFWPQLLANRRDKPLTRILNDVFKLNAESFQLLPDNRLMVLFEEYSLRLDVQGDGTRIAMRALMVLAMMKDTLLLLEEPECHQHPGSLERLARALTRLAREQEVQLLISTHSAECVRAFLEAAEAVGSEGTVFHLSLTDGQQEARRLDQEAVETLQATGVDVRFLDLYG